MLELNKIYNIDCLLGMREIPDKSIDMVLSDLPYNCLDCKWDKAIDLPAFWAQINRVIKDNAAVVLTANIKFAVALINANRKFFRYDLIWKKTMSVGFANSKRMPMRNHELILIFYKHLPTYNPQGLIPCKNQKPTRKSFADKDYAYPVRSLGREYVQAFTNYPKSVLEFSNSNSKSIHPTQKPLELFKYLMLTYSNPGDTVLDCCMGLGTTAVAAVETGRHYIGFETDERYFRLANERVSGSFGEGRADTEFAAEICCLTA